MKLTNAIKKLEKLGLEVKKNGPFFRAETDTARIEFFAQGDSITCINTCGLKLEKERDSMSDYFPETYHNNLSQAIRFVGL